MSETELQAVADAFNAIPGVTCAVRSLLGDLTCVGVVCFDSRETWVNHIVENQRHFKFYYCFGEFVISSGHLGTGHNLPSRKKWKTKDAQDAIAKLTAYCDKCRLAIAAQG